MNSQIIFIKHYGNYVRFNETACPPRNPQLNIFKISPFVQERNYGAYFFNEERMLPLLPISDNGKYCIWLQWDGGLKLENRYRLVSSSHVLPRTSRALKPGNKIHLAKFKIIGQEMFVPSLYRVILCFPTEYYHIGRKKLATLDAAKDSSIFITRFNYGEAKEHKVERG